MNVAVIGSGGREHAIVKKLQESKLVSKLYAIPGNGGMADDAECVAIGVNETLKIVDFVKRNGIEYVVVTPDNHVIYCINENLVRKQFINIGLILDKSIIYEVFNEAVQCSRHILYFTVVSAKRLLYHFQ